MPLLTELWKNPAMRATKIPHLRCSASRRFKGVVPLSMGGGTWVVPVLNLPGGGRGLGNDKPTFRNVFPSLGNHFPSLRRDQTTLGRLFKTFRQVFPSLENDFSRLRDSCPSLANNFPGLRRAVQTFGKVRPSLGNVPARLPGSFSTLKYAFSRLERLTARLFCPESACGIAFYRFRRAGP